jgi:hypothetical protein
MSDITSVLKSTIKEELKQAMADHATPPAGKKGKKKSQGAGAP